MTISVVASVPGADSIEPSLDHLVYATPDLEASVEEFAAVTGVRPAAGGRHLGRGTRNFLVGLGPGRYLEIIGPDLEHPAAPGAGLPFGIESLSRPRLLTWAVHTHDLDAAATRSAAAGADLGGAMPMSRRTPAGQLLEWRLASTVPLPLGGVTPFLIDWGASAHPSADVLLPRVSLDGLTSTHPAPEAVQAVLDALGLILPISAGEVALRAILGTPDGSVALS